MFDRVSPASGRFGWLGVSCLLTVLLLVGCSEPTREETTPEPDTRRELAAGTVVGTDGRYGGHVWRGIPYARPPVGERRWRAPRPPAARGDTWLALTRGTPCPQLGSRFGGVTSVEEGTPTGGEDCLYLDVYAPSFEPEEIPEGPDRLPVMVWIHGGGNVIGHTGLYDGSKLASEQDVIVVMIQYRLGPLGWFRHPALRGPSTDRAEASGNFALLDMVRALEWVRTNAAAFGGDPENVTIFGESAGGRNVYSLMLSPRAEGLFDRAIVQSGALRTTDPDRAEAPRDGGGAENSSREVLVRLLRADDRAEDAAEARDRLQEMGDTAVREYLRDQSPPELLEAYEPGGLGPMIEVPQVFADGHVLPEEDPLEVFARPDSYNQVPVMVGSNRDEAKLFLFGDSRWVYHRFWLFPRLREPELYEVLAEYMSNLWKGAGVDEPARVLRAAQGPSVYAYRFDWDEEPTVMGSDLSRMLGAAHGFEIPFVFGHFHFGSSQDDNLFTEGNRPGREALSAKMRAYWAEFAATGEPGTGGREDAARWRPWDPSDPGAPKYLRLDTEEDGGLRMESRTYEPEELIERVSGDSRLETDRQRCVVYRGMATLSAGFGRRAYREEAPCGDYPWDDYPWRE